MAESGGEKSGLGKFVKSQTKYGTTTKSTYTNDTFFKYHCSKGETLQGIALKHGVTMEEIKRANKIWTNDSLFLREYLLIPIHKQGHQDHRVTNGNLPSQSATQAPTDHHTSSGASPLEIVTRQDLQAASKTAHSKSTKLKDAKVVDSKQEQKDSAQKTEKKDSTTDFLSRMDSSLAQIKTKVKELDSNSEFPKDLTNPLNHLPQRKSSSLYDRRSWSRNRSSDSDSIDPASEPELGFRSRGHDRHVQTSRDNLEKRQDDIFQL